MKTIIGVIFGGKSVEHEVSIISAAQVMNAIDKEKYEVVPIYISKDNHFYSGNDLFEINTYKDMEKLKKSVPEVYFTHSTGKMIVNSLNKLLKKEIASIDIVFPVVHGLNVEDGTLQGFLEMYNIPYVGCDVTASAVGMNKIIFKKVLEASNIPVIKYAEVNVSDYLEDSEKVLQNIKERLTFPVILKPSNLGSSVGIKVVKNEADLNEALDFVFSFTEQVLVEKCVENLREINSAVLGNYEEQIVSILEEPYKTDEILSYKDKYMSENSSKAGSKSNGMASLTRQIPAILEKEQEEKIYDISKQVFKTINAEGIARIDYIIDCDTNEIFVNEINTIPGSISFYLWEPVGISFAELCDRAIKLAIKRSVKREKIIYSNDVNILSMHSKK